MKRSLGQKTLAIPAPVWVVATYGKDGKPNVMTAAWGGICCSKPPSVCVSLREATQTYGHLMERKAFTVNIPEADQTAIADYVGIVSGRDVDKFAACDLTAERSEHVDAPVVLEFPLNLECKIIHTLKIGLHTLFVGEIMNVLADEAILNEKGYPAIDKIDPPVFSVGDRTYHAIGDLIGPAFEMGRKIEKPNT